MQCDIDHEGNLIIACASEAEYQGMTAWLRRLAVPDVHLSDDDGQIRKTAVLAVDRIRITL